MNLFRLLLICFAASAFVFASCSDNKEEEYLNAIQSYSDNIGKHLDNKKCQDAKKVLEELISYNNQHSSWKPSSFDWEQKIRQFEGQIRSCIGVPNKQKRYWIR